MDGQTYTMVNRWINRDRTTLLLFKERKSIIKAPEFDWKWECCCKLYKLGLPLIAAVLIRLPLSTLWVQNLLSRFAESSCCRSRVTETRGPSVDEPHWTSAADERLSHHSRGVLHNSHCCPQSHRREGNWTSSNLQPSRDPVWALASQSNPGWPDLDSLLHRY